MPLRLDLVVLVLITMAAAIGTSRLLQQVNIARSQGASWQVAFLAYSSTIAFAGALLWVISFKVDALPLLFWGGAVVALVSSGAYLAIYFLNPPKVVLMPPTTTSGVRRISERTRAAGMVGIFGATVGVVSLHLEWLLVVIPALVLCLVGWAIAIVFALKDA